MVLQVFISYTQNEKELAIELANYLKSNGIRVFLDIWRIGFGERIAEVLSDALQASSTVILLASSSALSRPWVRTELDTALNLEQESKCRLLIIKIGNVRLPAILQGKKYFEIDHSWDETSFPEILNTLQPNIYRNGWLSSPREFAGNGGAVILSLVEEGFPFCRLHFKIGQAGGYAGVSWDIERGGVDISSFTHFSFRLCSRQAVKRLQLKFEMNGPWTTHYVDFPALEWMEYIVSLEKIGVIQAADILYRVTVAVDDCDVVNLGQDYLLDVCDFYFYRDMTGTGSP